MRGNRNFMVLFVCNAIVRVVTTICITYASVKLSMWGLLFFLIIPMFMGIDYKSGGGGESSND